MKLVWSRGDLKMFRDMWDQALRKTCPYLELFWSVCPCIRIEYGEIVRISPYSVQMRENVDQNNSKYWHFLRSEGYSTVSGLWYLSNRLWLRLWLKYTVLKVVLSPSNKIVLFASMKAL